MKSCLSVASSLNDYENRTAGLRDRVTKENEVFGMVFAKLFVYLQSERKELVFYDESIFAKSIGNTGFFT